MGEPGDSAIHPRPALAVARPSPTTFSSAALPNSAKPPRGTHRLHQLADGRAHAGAGMTPSRSAVRTIASWIARRLTGAQFRLSTAPSHAQCAPLVYRRRCPAPDFAARSRGYFAPLLPARADLPPTALPPRRAPLARVVTPRRPRRPCGARTVLFPYGGPQFGERAGTSLGSPRFARNRRRQARRLPRRGAGPVRGDRARPSGRSFSTKSAS